MPSLYFNCCKNPYCLNFAKAHSQSYHYPSYQLGYAALHCERCDSYPPLVDESAILQLLEPLMLRQLTQDKICDCPDQLWYKQPIKLQSYGSTTSGRPRYRCPQCLKVSCKTKLEFKQLEPILERIVNPNLPDSTTNPKLNYQRLSLLDSALQGFAQDLERPLLQENNQWELYTQGQQLEPSNTVKLWGFLTCESKSGYSLILHHNCAKPHVKLAPLDPVNKSSVIKTQADGNALTQIKDRYSQIFQRQHFEDLQYGANKGLRESILIPAAVLAYAHFVIVDKVFSGAGNIRHYLDHDSCLRGAALIAHAKRIQQHQLELYYFLNIMQSEQSLSAEGSSVGWWRDRWYPSPTGALCPITVDHLLHAPHPGIQHAARFFTHLNHKLPHGISRLKTLNQHLNIQRVIYNFCEVGPEGTTAAMRLGLYNRVLTWRELLGLSCNA
ncbi:hypothetical protein DBZ36_15265 [Alginatibacterium sediminis]|uniref:IS1 family transposase n=2 Tax=Alginatibacterium sediminis TaxID=2164068 RepID=A0A420E8M4_9ALTE|nr:hypothetical protein DBZ36_15265 [Alginatibacterium sediminis]